MVVVVVVFVIFYHSNLYTRPMCNHFGGDEDESDYKYLNPSNSDVRFIRQSNDVYFRFFRLETSLFQIGHISVLNYQILFGFKINEKKKIEKQTNVC